MPSPSNNFNFPSDIVARFEEGYRSNPAAGMEAMRKTYVRSLLIRSLRPSACMVQNVGSISYIAIFLSSDPGAVCLALSQCQRLLNSSSLPARLYICLLIAVL